jgi:hypothetical protein
VRLTQRLDAQPKVATSAARSEVSQVEQVPQGLIIAGRLRGRDERFDFGPQSGLAPDESVQVLLPGDCRFPLAPYLFRGLFLGLDAFPLPWRASLQPRAVARTVLPLVTGPAPAAPRCRRKRCSSSATAA